MSASLLMAACCCGGCPTLPCSGSTTVVVSCTGKHLNSATITVTGTVSGSCDDARYVYRIESNGDTVFYVQTYGSISGSFSITFRVPTATNFSGQIVADVFNDLDTPANSYNELEQHGSATISAPAIGLDWTSTPDPTSTFGGGDVDITYTSASVTIDYVLTAAGDLTISTSFSVVAGGLFTDGAGDPRFGGDTSAQMTETRTGSISASDLCAGTTVTATTVTSNTAQAFSSASGQGTMDFAPGEGPMGDAYSDGSATGSTTGSGSLDIQTTEEDHYFSAKGCPRFYTISGFNFSGRIAMEPVLGACSAYLWSYYGGGTIGTGDDQRAAGIRLVRIESGASGTVLRHVQLRLYYSGNTLAHADPDDVTGNYTISYVYGGTTYTTAALNNSSTRSAVQSALVAVAPAGVSVRVEWPGGQTFILTGVDQHGTGINFTVTNAGATVATVGAPFLDEPYAATTFRVSAANCPTASTGVYTRADVTVEFPVFTGLTSFSLASTTRIPGDPTYYCDCTANCPTAPSSVLLTITAPTADEFNPEINESPIITKTTSTPCAYAVAWTNESGALNGDNSSATITTDSEGVSTLNVYDDEDSLILTATAPCGDERTLPDLDWTVITAVGHYAPYAGTITVTTS